MKPKLSNSSALRIVAAAREEFSRRGFDGARMDQIARRAAVNKQLLFYYFHSKRGLFTAVLARGAAELEQALAELPTGGERPLDRREQAPLGVEIVEKQLLVHRRPPGNLIHAGAVESATRELLAGCGHNP